MTEFIKSDFELAAELQAILINKATGEKGGAASNIDYQRIRTHFLKKKEIKSFLSNLVQKNRDLDQFWRFIKNEFALYAEKREYIYAEFSPFFDFLEHDQSVPLDLIVSEGLKRFNEVNVHVVWQKALERRITDPEGAITSARRAMSFSRKPKDARTSG